MSSRPFRTSLVIACVAFAANHFVAAAEPAKRWAVLPQSVETVCTARDGRLWTLLATDYDSPPSLVEIKANIEQQFSPPAPEIGGVHFALLDDPRRVWFYADRDRLLLGYDGKQWIERRAGPNRRFVGSCPTRGQICDGGVNRTINGVNWFLDQGGIYRFDGEQWSYQDFAGSSPDVQSQPQLIASPNGRHLLATTYAPKRLWVFNDGRWIDRALPPGVDGALVVTDAGDVWYLSDRQQLRSFSLAMTEERAEKEFKTLLAELKAATFDRRETATTALIRLAPYLGNRLEQALKNAADAEVRMRLKRVVQAAARAQTDQRVQSLAGYEFTDPVGMLQDDRGRLFLAAGQVLGQGADRGSGVIVVHPDGRSEAVGDRDLAQALIPFIFGQSPPIVVGSGDSLWVSLPTSKRGAWLFDLARNRVVAEVPDPHSYHLRAVDSHGRLFVSSMNLTGRVMAFAPEIPDPRTPLEVIGSPWDVDLVRVAEDGAVWVHRPESHVMRFDGRQWQEMCELKTHQIRFAMGADGVVVVAADGFVGLYQHDKLLDRGDSIKTLIQTHRNLIADAFRRSRTSAEASFTKMSIAADREKNIWLRYDEQAFVLKGEEWLSVLGAMSSPMINLHILAQAGDGGEVFLSNCGLGGRSLLGRIQDGKLVFRTVTAANHTYSRDHGLRESGGALWIAGHYQYSDDKYSGLTGNVATRFNTDEKDLELKGVGWPILVDPSDCVWLNDWYYLGDPRLRVWRGGKIEQTLELPDTDKVHAAFSDAPGSVYVSTAAGLQHLVSESPAAGYRLGELYKATGIPAHWYYYAYSRLGYIVIHTVEDTSERRNNFYLVRLPTPPSP